MNSNLPANTNPTRGRDRLGVAAEYRFGRWREPVRLLKLSRGRAIVVFVESGVIDTVPLHRVTVSS